MILSLRLTLLLVACLAWPTLTSAQTPLIECSFQDTSPYNCTTDNGAATAVNLAEDTSRGPGACASTVGWNHEHVASGGWNDRAYVKITYCEYDVSGITGTWTGGFTFGSPADLDDNLTATTGAIYGRFRIYMPDPIVTDDTAPTTDVIRSMKFFQFHTGVYDGDQRLILFLERGDMCGVSATDYVCVSIGRNINTGLPLDPESGTDVARAALSLDAWHHVRYAWLHGAENTSYLKLWVDTTSATPTMEDLALTAVPTVPGGTSEWVRDDAGYTSNDWAIGKSSSNIRFENNFEIRLMDFIIDDADDLTWYSEGGNPPDPPVRLRFRLPGDHD